MGEADLVFLIRMFEFYVLYLNVKERSLCIKAGRGWSLPSRKREKHPQFNGC
jgi:hypothetical protein